MTTARTDAELMTAFQQGEVAAFEELVERHHRGLVNYFYHHARDRQLAEDWAQEVFLRVVSHARSYVARARFTTFLYRIARNLWIDVIRERVAHRRPSSLDAPDADGGRREEWIASSDRRPEELLASDELSVRVRDAIDRLPEDLREVVVLSELQGLKYAEISETMGIPVGTVKSRMHTAVRKLKTLLTPLMEGRSAEAAPAPEPASGDDPAGGRGAAGGMTALLVLATALAGPRLDAAEPPAAKDPPASEEPAAPAGEPTEALIPKLAHKDWAVREAALQAIVARGGRAVPALAEYLVGAGDSEGVARARDALCRIGWPALVYLMNRGVDAPVAMVDAREACVRAFLDRAIGKRSLADNTWVAGDPPVADPAKLSAVWETGSGHAFLFRLYRLRWDAGVLRADRIAYAAGRKPYTTPNPPEETDAVKIETTTLQPEAARAMFALALRACAVRLQPKEKSGALRAWSSTANFHSRIRLEQDGVVVFEETYTGYPGSNNEKQYVRVDVASGVFAAALRRAAWKERAADETDLQLLLDRTGGFGTDAWWVRERLVQIVGALGDRRFEPFLRKVIGMPLEKVTRRHYHAINAYARITGVDLRTKPVEKMNVAGIRARYLARFEGELRSKEGEKR